MKVIDLLNKIANGEEVPKKIKYQFKTFELNDSGIYLRTDKVRDYDYGIKSLLEYVLTCDLNDEIEIIEEEKNIEEIEIDNFNRIKAPSTGNFAYQISMPQKIIIKKINELVKAVNELKKEGN